VTGARRYRLPRCWLPSHRLPSYRLPSYGLPSYGLPTCACSTGDSKKPAAFVFGACTSNWL
jgi:hypothetical protein